MLSATYQIGGEPRPLFLIDIVAIEAKEMTSLSLSVLVAEDNPVNQEVAIGLLETLHCEVTVVDDGAQALEAYKTAAPAQFDLILMDCQMPKMDGMEATRRIREWEGEARHIPILALTANAISGSKEACLEAGMDDMLSKPFRRQELQKLLEKWCPGDARDEHQSVESDQMSAGSPLNQQSLQFLRDLDPDGSKRLVHRTIVKFVSYGDDLINNMAQSLADNDMAEMSRLAHSMKSSSANLGATDVSRQCQEIESATKDQERPDDISQQLQALTTAYQASKQALLSVAEKEAN